MIQMVACVDMHTGGIGYKGELLYSFKEDMQRFVDLTKKTTVVMGRKTAESLPHGFLKGRKNVVLSTSDYMTDNPLVVTVKNKDTLIDMVTNDSRLLDDTISVIGGSALYEMFLPYADIIHLTVVDAEDIKVADTYFPHFNWEDYQTLKRDEIRIGGDILHFDELIKKELYDNLVLAK